MGITGVGSSYNFIYNTRTGKLSTKDGSKSEFVDFCNGDVKGEDTETLNHFDEHTRYQFQRMVQIYLHCLRKNLKMVQGMNFILRDGCNMLRMAGRKKMIWY